MLVGELGIAQLVLCLFVINHRDNAAFVRVFSPSLFTLRRYQSDVCEVRRLALFECLLARFDALSFEFDLALIERRLSLLQETGELWAVYGREYLPGHHFFAGTRFEGDGACGSRIQGRTDSRHDPSLDGNVANEVSPGYNSGPNSFNGYARGGVRPAFDPRSSKQDRRDNGDAYSAEDKLIAARIARRQPHILRRRVGNFQFPDPQGRQSD